MKRPQIDYKVGLYEKGEDNTSFFHSYIKHRKNVNSIWKLKDDEGRVYQGQQDLSKMGIKHFRGATYSQSDQPSVLLMMDFASDYPRMVSPDDGIRLRVPISIEELKAAISNMHKDKFPGLYGWVIEFYEAFMDIMEEEILEVIEESCIRGRILALLILHLFI